MKILCVFTNKFPYSNVEPYLETEVKHYKMFDKIYVFSLIVKKSEESDIRSVPDDFIVYPIRNDKLGYIFGGFRALFDKNFYREIKKLSKGIGVNFRRILSLLIYISRSHVDSVKISRLLKNELCDNDVVFYTYRFEYQPYTAILVKQKLKLDDINVVSRAHGYDLYEERSAGSYIPLRDYLIDNLDYVFPCSNAGEIYLKDRFPLRADKIRTRYLGTNDHGLEQYSKNDGTFRIVSCSNIVPIKRIDRIIDVLSLIDSEKVEWIHFGAGDEESHIRMLAEEKLSNRISFVFKGSVNNSDLMQYYKENTIDLFINLSDGEGLPVSIMEAFSFGIPCVATNVGGTSEIVDDQINGFLVNTTDSNKSIAEMVDSIISMENERYLALRFEARKTWEERFNAENNYKDYISDLVKLSNTK